MVTKYTNHIFQEEKTKNILSFADRIVEGKKKKLINKLKKKKSTEGNTEDSDQNIIKIDRLVFKSSLWRYIVKGYKVCT